MEELTSRYNPNESEGRIYQYWQENNLFSAGIDPRKKPFCVVIPPPNVTGILHMGHALNSTYQDILIRLKRMQGFESLWMPGTDHAGIATQNVVERQIAKEGLSRKDLGREKFLERTWRWKELYGPAIIKQLKKIGASCDWERIRFTMDEEYSMAVKEVFIRLWDKGLIYQDDKIINWCPRCQTALSDEEAAHRQLQGNLYYIKYPLEEPIGNSLNPKAGRKNALARQPSVIDYVVVATTRPETMLGDTAVAVNPNDRRYKKLIGKTVILPLTGRHIKIIADESVDPKFGTGAVKVTPAHDPNDYEIGKRHKLESINIMHPNAILNEQAGEYSNRDRFEAREAIVEDLKEGKYLEKIEPHQHAVGHCYRCHTIIEPYLSLQWFVRMKPLAEPALEAVKKEKVRFYPKRWTKVYLNWMENIQDWCISRQIWWGHRLPVYYCKDCLAAASRCKAENVKCEEKGIIVAKVSPRKCPVCGGGDIYQDEDVLDTWFSSWLWPFAAFYWPKDLSPKGIVVKEELDYFYPTSVLVTAPEIIFFWVARMIMAGFEFIGREPFRDVYIHGTVRDAQGKKMSKSLGNIIDPLEAVEKYGADALRFSLMFITSSGQDVFLSEQKFELGRNFANKLWNASRFSMMNLDLRLVDTDLCVLFKNQELGLAQRWILSRFYSMLTALNKAMDNYRFNDAVNIIYEFIWHEFCDWYLELIKPELALRFEDIQQYPDEIRSMHVILYKVLEKSLRCLHPFMPFITEDIWQKLQIAGRQPQIASIMTQPWPHIQKQMIDKKSESEMRLLIKIITAIRNLRAQMNIPAAQETAIHIFCDDKKRIGTLKEVSNYIARLVRLKSLDVREELTAKKKGVSVTVENIQVLMELEGIIDICKELDKYNQEMAILENSLKAKEARLKNEDFLSKAPLEIVDKEKEAVIKGQEKREGLKKIIEALRSMAS